MGEGGKSKEITLSRGGWFADEGGQKGSVGVVVMNIKGGKENLGLKKPHREGKGPIMV